MTSEADRANNTCFDSKTEVVLRVDEPRGTCSFKGNKELWKGFVSYCKANFGSVCHVLEPIQIALLTKQVVQSNTIRPLVIENLIVERAVKRVRRYSVEEVEEVSFLEYSSCQFPRCKRRGIWGVLRLRKGLKAEVKCCKSCFETWKGDPRYEVVRVVADG
jgi:hypothetical protein